MRYGNLLFLNQSLLRDDSSTARYLTQLVYDRPEVQQRYTVGDFTALSGELGSVLPMGGLNLSKVYSLTPDLIHQPLAGISGVATSPSQVEVRVGGVPVAYSQVATGPFELQNLRQYGGASNVQVVVRDALGREQAYSFPFYYSDQSLREGLQEYSYSLGKLRVNPGQPHDDYTETAFSGFHRFGYSDALTLGARAEAANDLNNLGVEATWRNDQWGVLSAALSTSTYQGRTGDAAMLSYSYQQSNYALRTIARSYSDNYAPLETLLTPFNRSGEYGVGATWYAGVGSTLSLNHTLTQTHSQGDTHLTSLSYFHNLSAASSLYATLQRSDDGVQPNTSLFVGWFYRFDNKFNASVTASADEAGQQSLYTQLQSDIPLGEGFGYRVGWTGSQPQNTDRFNGFAQWNLPALSLTIESNTLPALGGQADYHEWAAAGSIAFAGRAWGASRQISDSFAIVQMGSPVAGVHVLANSQEIGVSNAEGQVISPYLGSYSQSQIALNDQDVPLQYVMGSDNYAVKPAYRSGVRVNFGLRQVHALAGVLRVRNGADTVTADNLVVTLHRSGQAPLQFQVGRAGQFYMEDISPGEYHGQVASAERNCSFALVVPDSQELVFTMPGDLVCEPNP